jgi:PAS domain S-box-containing protein
VAIDITDQKRTEERLRDSDLGRELAMQAAELGRFDHRPSTGQRVYDQRALDMVGLTSAEVRTFEDVLLRVVHPDDREGLSKAVRDAVDPRRIGPLKHTYRITHAKTGEERWLTVIGRSQFSDGACVRFMGVFEDVTDEKVADQQRRLMTNELNHRVKNTLAIVSSVVDQSLRKAANPLTAREDINSRIQALSRAHDILTADSWSGAAVSSIVRQLIDTLSLPIARLEISGGPLRLGPRPALQLALALHELATNALKYGALSNDTGRVTLAWGSEGVGAEAIFFFRWRERGGPTVSEPARRGFGSALIGKATEGAFYGKVVQEYLPVGVCWVLTAPLRGLAESGRGDVG